MIPGVLEPALFGWDAQAVKRMSLGEYGGRVLARICQAAWSRRGAGRGRLVNYRQLPEIVWPSLMRYWGADCPATSARSRDARLPVSCQKPRVALSPMTRRPGLARRRKEMRQLRPAMARRGLPTTGNATVDAGRLLIGTLRIGDKSVAAKMRKKRKIFDRMGSGLRMDSDSSSCKSCSSLKKQLKPQMNTDRHRSEGVAHETAVTQRVKDVFQSNLCSSVSICGFRSFHKIQPPDLGSSCPQVFGNRGEEGDWRWVHHKFLHGAFFLSFLWRKI